MTVRDYSTTAASNNAAPPNGWPEGQAASTVNDCGRQMMADIRESFEELPYFDYGDDPTRVDNDTFTLATDLTARYPVGARVKLVGATTGTGRITSSAFGAVTTIDVVMDSGNVPLTLTRVAVAPAPVAASTATPAAVTLTASAGTSGGVSRDDHVHALSQSIAPTWTGAHSFTFTDATRVGPVVTNSAPGIDFIETGVAADNAVWRQVANAEQLTFQAVNDIISASGTWMTVDRTGTTVDRVAFPTEGTKAFSIGTPDGSTYGSSRAEIRTTTASATALATRNVTSASASLVVVNEATSGDNSFIVFFTESGAGTNRGNIDFNRAGTAVRYNTTSDGRLKRNVRQSSSALDLVMSLPVDSFDWIEGDVHVEHGFVAQKLYEVFPDAVSGGGKEDGIMGIDRGALVPVLAKGLQETIEENRSLRSSLDALIERVGRLERRADAASTSR